MKATLVSNPVDLLYLTGQTLSKGLLILCDDESRLYVDARYFEEVKKKARYPVHLWEEKAPFEWLQKKGVKDVGFDSAATTYDAYLSYAEYFPKLTPISGVCKEKRRIKNEHEIKLLKKAADLTLRGIHHVKGMLQVGATELELAWEFEKYVREHGASGLSFEPIIAFGKASASPHHRACKAALHEGDVVLIDVGAIVDSYRGDLTRVEFFGPPNPILARRLALLQEASCLAINAVRSGIKIGEIDQVVRDFFKSHGVEHLFTHSLGHGIGLETHESPLVRKTGPDRDLPIEEGMVFTIEPGLYDPEIGGVRYEEMVVVKDGKGVLLTC